MNSHSCTSSSSQASEVMSLHDANNMESNRASQSSEPDKSPGNSRSDLGEVDNRVHKKARITPECVPTTCIDDGHDTDLCGDNGRSPPFYRYKDFSREEDPDPLTPLTPPGRVPNFPAKMHAILCRRDLQDVVAWMPHGRSWRVLKPRDFELRVIPTYFEHSKFSSFIRQANGWGFRRITQGRDRNSYYHELFLRGLPHLCKRMKRPGVAEKGAVDVECEPDFQTISEMYPLPAATADDESILLPCTLQGGPKARMPIYSGVYLSADKINAIRAPPQSNRTPHDHQGIVAFQNALASSENQIAGHMNSERCTEQQSSANPMLFFPQGFRKNALHSLNVVTRTPSDHDGVAPCITDHNHNPINTQKLPEHDATTNLHNATDYPARTHQDSHNSSADNSDLVSGFEAATALNSLMDQAFLSTDFQSHTM